MEGGVAIFLFLLIVGGAGVGGFLLFGTGARLRRKQMKGELGEPDRGRRPTHHHVSDDSDATFDIPSQPGPGVKPPMPSE